MATASATEARPTRFRSSMLGARLGEAAWGYGFAFVPFAVFGLFFIYPFVYAIYISFFHWGILGRQPGAAGTYNYAKILHDPVFHTALKNIAEYTVAVVPLEMGLGLLLALLVNGKIRGRNFFRSGFYFPSIASSVAITVIILYMFAPRGPFNTFFGFSTDWFGNASTVGWGIVGLNGWTTSGTVMIFYLAALQSISNDVYEAAALDGAGAWRTFWKVTFPLLRPAHFFCLVIFGIGALKLFDQAFIVSGGTGGPNYATTTPILYIYQLAFKTFDFGVASAAGVVFLGVILVLTIAQWFTIGRQEAS
jgi:multiple sugar transport system permease protein